VKQLRFQPGDIVFVRWHGDIEFEIVREHECDSLMPHFVCKVFADFKWNYWIFPQIQISSSNISIISKGHNRKQLALL
jgi:hypothetical protein